MFFYALYIYQLGSFYEDISIIIAKSHCDKCFKKYSVKGETSQNQEKVIRTIIRELRGKNRETDIKKEMRDVLEADRKATNLKSLEITCLICHELLKVFRNRPLN